MTRATNAVRPLALALILVVSVIAMTVPPVTAHSTSEPAFIVELNADGSAEVTLRSTFDLTTDSEQEAFRTLMDDEQAQQNAKDRFLERMRAVASDAENATGREMAVMDPTIDLYRSDDSETGVVTLSVTWEGLAAVDGETLRVTEPFASGFSPDRPFIIRVPDGYVITSVTPNPDERGGTRVAWKSGSDLTGLSVEMEAEDTPSPVEDDDGVIDTDGQPGFGWLVALLALLGATKLVLGKSRRGRDP